MQRKHIWILVPLWIGVSLVILCGPAVRCRSVLAEGQAPAKAEDPLAVPKFDPAQQGFNLSGMHWGKDGLTEEIYDRELKLIHDLGFGWLRPAFEWHECEPEKGKFDWTYMDIRVRLAEKYGLQLCVPVGFSTMWAADGPEEEQTWARSKYPPKDLKDMTDFVEVLVKRYKNDVHYWEGWNEHNDHGGFWKIPPSGRDPVEHYVAWQRAFYKAAKKADPKCVILTGGFAGTANMVQQVEECYKKGLKGTFDIMNIHIYPADPREKWFTDMIEGVIRVMRKNGDGYKKIWITESGWPTKNHEFQRTEAQQAEWAPWLWAVALRYPQVQKLFFFELRERADERGFGWYDSSFAPRPVVKRWEELRKHFAAQSASKPSAKE